MSHVDMRAGESLITSKGEQMIADLTRFQLEGKMSKHDHMSVIVLASSNGEAYRYARTLRKGMLRKLADLMHLDLPDGLPRKAMAVLVMVEARS